MPEPRATKTTEKENRKSNKFNRILLQVQSKSFMWNTMNSERKDLVNDDRIPGKVIYTFEYSYKGKYIFGLQITYSTWYSRCWAGAWIITYLTIARWIIMLNQKSAVTWMG